MACQPKLAQCERIELSQKRIATSFGQPQPEEDRICTADQVANSFLGTIRCNDMLISGKHIRKRRIIPGTTRRSDVLGISPKSRPREVADEALELKELEKLSVALSQLSEVSSEVCRRRLGRMS